MIAAVVLVMDIIFGTRDEWELGDLLELLGTSEKMLQIGNGVLIHSYESMSLITVSLRDQYFTLF
jgi:hypothetical protein